MRLETALLSHDSKGTGFEKRTCEEGGTEEVRDQGQSKEGGGAKLGLGFPCKKGTKRTAVG